MSSQTFSNQRITPSLSTKALGIVEIVLLSFIFLPQIIFAQQQPYDVLWQKSYYPDSWYDLNNDVYAYTSHDESGEDWMYAIQRWYDPENLTSHEGYIMSGYTSFKNKPIRIFECDPPITVAEFPDPPTGRPAINELECDDPLNWKGSQHGAVMKIDESGNMEWYKVFGEEYGEMFNLIQAKESGDGKYIFTAGRGGNQLTGVQYRYLDALNTEQVTTLSCSDPCDFYTQFRSSRRFYIVKLDGSNSGEVEWQYT